MNLNSNFNLSDVIAELRRQKTRCEEAIASLESLQRAKERKQQISMVAAARPSRRGRKHMDPHERQQVSARMKAYWDRRRNSAGVPPAGASATAGS